MLSHRNHFEFKLTETIVQYDFLSFFKESELQIMFSIKPLATTTCIDGFGQAGDLLTDLLKAFDFIDLERLIVKL